MSLVSIFHSVTGDVLVASWIKMTYTVCLKMARSYLQIYAFHISNAFSVFATQPISNDGKFYVIQTVAKIYSAESRNDQFFLFFLLFLRKFKWYFL